mmetsp:Transcript_12873/g.35555  ORF Transcript_12873/g.35555 Transcript_12873/m.35555 type:complete len:115 (+) Transcript_12873:157-501(+)
MTNEMRRSKRPKPSSEEKNLQIEVVNELKMNGDWQRMQQQLYASLMADAQWRDDLIYSAKVAIQNNSNGISGVTYGELVAEAHKIPAHNSIPDEVGEKIKASIQSQINAKRVGI